MISISVSARALVAARAVDPQVSTAAVRAAVEVALAEQRRELEIRRAGGCRRRGRRRHPPLTSPTASGRRPVVAAVVPGPVVAAVPAPVVAAPVVVTPVVVPPAVVPAVAPAVVLDAGDGCRSRCRRAPR